LGAGRRSTLTIPPQKVREDFGTARFDQVFSDKDTFSGVYTIDDGISSTPVVTGQYFSQLNYRAHVLSLSEVHIFSPSFLNTFTAGFSRAPVHDSRRNKCIHSCGYYRGCGCTTAITEYRYNRGNWRSYLCGWAGRRTLRSHKKTFSRKPITVQLTKGIHLISFGVWFERLQDQDNPGIGGGGASFTNLATFLQGQLSLFTAAYPTALGFRSFEGSVVRLRIRSGCDPRLTVTAGIRHEFTNGWSEQDGRLSLYIPNPATGVLLTQPRVSSQAFFWRIIQ